MRSCYDSIKNGPFGVNIRTSGETPLRSLVKPCGGGSSKILIETSGLESSSGLVVCLDMHFGLQLSLALFNGSLRGRIWTNVFSFATEKN